MRRLLLRTAFEIDGASARLLASSLTVQSYSTSATIAVTFGPDAGVAMWMPLSMEEQYRGNFNGLVTGLAKYLHYRQFKSRDVDENPLSLRDGLAGSR